MTIAMVLAMNGCMGHRKVQPFVPPPFTPVELAQVPAPPDLPLVEADEDDVEDLPPVPVAGGAAEPPRQRKRAARPAVQAAAAVPETPPAQIAAPGPTGESSVAVGEFTPGGDLDPKAQREAAELIAANEKRLNGLSAEVARGQAALVSNVRNFQKQAQAALKAGDAAGAKTLATKGKLLLDDLEKAAGV